jgi:hypothetical protein
MNGLKRVRTVLRRTRRGSKKDEERQSEVILLLHVPRSEGDPPDGQASAGAEADCRHHDSGYGAHRPAEKVVHPKSHHRPEL